MTASGNVCVGPGVDMELTIFGTASTAGVPDTPGTTIVNTASASITFIDGSSMTPTALHTVNVVNLVPTPFLGKSGAMPDFNGVNKGQYTFNGTAYPYTFPGNWTGSGTPMSYLITLATNLTNAGVGFAVQDPLPCLSNLSGGVYTSNAPGTTCANPAFIPTVVTASGFTPTAFDTITVTRADGTTATIAYSPAAGGWPVPASPAVSEIDIPQFPEEEQHLRHDELHREGLRRGLGDDAVTADQHRDR